MLPRLISTAHSLNDPGGWPHSRSSSSLGPPSTSWPRWWCRPVYNVNEWSGQSYNILYPISWLIFLWEDQHLKILSPAIQFDLDVETKNTHRHYITCKIQFKSSLHFENKRAFKDRSSKMKGIRSNTGGSPDLRMALRSESKCLRGAEYAWWQGCPRATQEKFPKNPRFRIWIFSQIYFFNQSHLHLEIFMANVTGIPENASQKASISRPPWSSESSHVVSLMIDYPGILEIMTEFLEHAWFFSHEISNPKVIDPVRFLLAKSILLRATICDGFSGTRMFLKQS